MNLNSIFWLGTLFSGLSILGLILYNKDKQRVSGSCYKVKENEYQNEIKQKKVDEFKQRLLIFPSLNDKETIRTFVIRQV